MRHGECAADDDARQAARLVVGALKSALPLMGAVGEVRRWDRSAGAKSEKPLRPLTLGLLFGSAAMELAVLMGLTLAGGRLSSPIVLIEALLPAALALGGAYWAGLSHARPDKAADIPDTREEFLIDPEKVWHSLHGMLLLADDTLARARADAGARRTADADPMGGMDRAEAELFSGLLESAYALDTSDGREMAESMRFYLHGRGIEVVDYAPGREARFEFLPADRPGTLRPALVCGERTVKKGLAAR